MMTNAPTLGSVGSCDARKHRLLELEINKRLQVRRNELVKDEDDHDHDETHEPNREHGEVEAVPASYGWVKFVAGFL